MLGVATIDVRRLAGGERTDGVWVPGTECRVSVRGAIQPLSARDLEMLPEGERTREQMKLYVPATQEDLRTACVEHGEQADQVVHRGRRWEVHSWQDHTAAPFLAHSRYRLVAVGDDELEHG